MPVLLGGERASREELAHAVHVHEYSAADTHRLIFAFLREDAYGVSRQPEKLCGFRDVLHECLVEVELNPSLWKSLNFQEKKNVIAICEEKLNEYYEGILVT